MQNIKMKLKIVYDNNAEKGFKPGWGFSCLIENKKKVLFDTGADSETLLYNMEKLEIDPKAINAVVLSHNHGDHTGGLSGFLEANGNKAKVYQPTAFSKPTEIYPDIYSTGAVEGFEQALVIKSPKGLVVMTGCAHPGVVNMVRKAKEISEKLYLVLGGFHLGDATNVIKEFKALGIEKAAPCHCSGDLAREQFRKEYKENFIENGVGNVIRI